MEGVEEAVLHTVDNTNSILTTRKKPMQVLLTVNDDFRRDTAETIAEVVASVIGNDTTTNIRWQIRTESAFWWYLGSIFCKRYIKGRYRDATPNTFINNIYMGLIKSGYDMCYHA